MVALDEIGLIWLSVPIMSGLGASNFDCLRYVHLNDIQNSPLHLVAFITQVFYAYRIRVLSQSWFAPSIITLVSNIVFCSHRHDFNHALSLPLFNWEAVLQRE